MRTLIIICSLFYAGFTFSQVTFTNVAPTLGVADPGNGQGTVFFDFNNDGFLDIYLVNNGSSNRLYMNSGGTSFTEVGAALGVANNGAGRGCAIADFNSDGLLDIVVGNFNQPMILFKNNSSSFSRYTDTAGMNLLSYGGSINWFDYNNDGKIDCYMGNNGIPPRVNYLFRNNNFMNFSQVADSVGFTDITSTISTACADYDNDGDVDLFTGSQTSIAGKTNFLYKNNGNGTYTDVATPAGLIVTLFSWGADWGDFDNDGDLDLYVCNFNGANNLFQNNGSGTFTDVALAQGVADLSQSFTCGWADYDNDGLLDLFVGNGSNGSDKLYKNNGITFTDVALSVGINDTLLSNSSTWGDYDNNGYPDLYCSNNGVPNRLFKNSGGANRWLIVKLKGIDLKNSPIGARVTLKTGPNTYIREVQGGSGHNGQNSLPLEFGVAGSMTIDSLIVRWPRGNISRLSNVSTNQILDVTEIPTGIISNGNNIPGKYSLSQNFPNPFNPATKINYALPVSGSVNISVFNTLGVKLATLINEFQNAGNYTVDFNAGELSSGIYFYRIETLDFNESRKMNLIK